MSSDSDAGDVKTLRMASPKVSRQALEGYLQYQRAFLEALKSSARIPHPLGWEGRFAQADLAARAKANLDAEQGSRMRALCDDYCGKLSTAERLRRAATAGELAPEVADKARVRADVLASQDFLKERYGEGWLVALNALAPELLALHKELSSRLT